MPITQSSIASNVISGATGATGPSGSNGTNGATGATGGTPWVLNGPTAYYNGGQVGVGTSTPTGQFHVYGTNYPQINVSDSLTNGGKNGIIGSTHYTVSNAPIGIAHVAANLDTNILNLGGGSSVVNSATKIGFYTAANTTTATGTERMAITSAGDIGIGTNNPTTKTEIYGTAAASSIALRVTNTATDGYSTLWLGDSNGALFRNGSTQTGYAGANSLNLGTIAAHNLGFITNNTERMRIDSDGRVTTPFRPGFVAHATGNPNYTSVSDNVPFPANATNYNQGSCYNTSNYRFTAPITGLYLFTFSGINNNTSSGSRPMFYVNGTGAYNGIQHGISNQDGGGSNSNATSSLIYLQANDYVFVASQAGSLYYYGSGHSTFSGCLIG